MNRRPRSAAFVLLVVFALFGISTVSAEMFGTWRESADAASTAVRSVMVGGRHLVTTASMYDPRRRIIHEENAEVDYPVQMSEREWQRRLSAEEYDIIRRAGTEQPFSSDINAAKERGVYYSRATGQPLFSSDDQFDSGTGWPSFTRPITPDALAYFWDRSLFSQRIEVVDSLSGAHLGHVFSDGPAPTGQRYCINGDALIFVPEGGEPPELLLPGD